MRLLLVGDGRMGHAIRDLAAGRGHTVVAMLGIAENPEGQGIAPWRGKADVAIEFTQPASAATNVRACLAAGLPVVCGTTGWDAERADVESHVGQVGGALLVAPNFSLGVALFLEVARRAGALFAGHDQFAPAIVEVHHAAKLDAPSGTARALHEAASTPLGRDIPVSSVRVGSVPGTHTLLFDAPFEQIVMTHEARDRRVFADGALHAAEWLAGRVGVFTMGDLLLRNER